MTPTWQQKCALSAEIEYQANGLFPDLRGQVRESGREEGESVATCASALGESALALDDIFETMKQCGLFEPHARAVWFIDAEEEYQQFRRIVIDQLCEYPPLELCRSPLFTAEEALLGLPIRVWSLREIEERMSSAIVDELNKHIAPAKVLEIVGRSFPFRRPGVFVEMSDGNHLEIKEWLKG